MAGTPPPNYRQIAQQDAAKYGLGPWFVSQIQQESGFDPNAKSGAGAEGIAQFEPATAKSVGLSNPFDPVASLDAAARFDQQLLHRYGSVPRALSAYNSGNPDAYLNPSFAGGQTTDYVHKILGGQNPTTAPPAGVSQQQRSLAAAAGATVAPQQPPQVDYRPKLASELAAAASSPTNDLRSFYGTLHQALEQRNAPQPADGASTAHQDVTFHGTSRAQQVAAQLPRTQVGQSIAKTALTQIGTPYQWGGQAKLGSPTDCSGLLQASAAANGVKIGRTTYEQWKQGIPVPLNQLQPGDAVFFHMGEQGPGHVAIYIGNGRVVEDPHTGAAVEISQLAGRGAVGARRYG